MLVGDAQPSLSLGAVDGVEGRWQLTATVPAEWSSTYAAFEFGTSVNRPLFPGPSAEKLTFETHVADKMS